MEISSLAIRKMVWELSREGYLESPLRGCWRLTEKAHLLLKGVHPDGRPNGDS